MNVKQEEHQLEFLSEGFLPISRISGAPAPENGAAQSLQRGSCGISLKTRRPARSLECPRLRKSRQNSSFSLLGGTFGLTAPLGSHGNSSKTTRPACTHWTSCVPRGLGPSLSHARARDPARRPLRP